MTRHCLAQGDRSRRATGISSKHSAGSDIVPEDIVSSESGDLAYMVGFERGEVSHDANAPMMITIRVTRIYRPINAEWCFVHRHADFPPAHQGARD
jgi:ketosteroid isomerase-like protein